MKTPGDGKKISSLLKAVSYRKKCSQLREFYEKLFNLIILAVRHKIG